MKAVVSAAQMSAIDQATIAEIGLPGVVLMENAGRAVATAVRPLVGAGFVAVVCGSGNNGGDGYVVARVLREWGLDARVYLAADSQRVRGDARTHLDAYRRSGGPVFGIETGELLARHRAELRAASVVVDAVFGTGLDRVVEGHYASVIGAINEARGAIVAVDLPSGLSADSGRPLGIAVHASHTVTMAFHKLATASTPGFASCGEVTVAEIGIPSELAASHGALARVVEEDDVAAVLPRAHALDYKNRRGHLLVIAGSPGKWGAGRLTALAGLRAGAGLVTLAGAELDAQVDSSVMTACASSATLADLLAGKAAVAVGPGMATGQLGAELVDALVSEFEGPKVLDADALNHLATRGGALPHAETMVLTPHPGEAARLLGESAADVELDRVGAVRRLVQRTGATCVLKGARTLIGHEDAVLVVPAGGPELATAGSGDVLTGTIGALLAQGLEPMRAALAGVFVHGRAGAIGGARHGLRGLIASDLPALVAEAIASMTR